MSLMIISNADSKNVINYSVIPEVWYDPVTGKFKYPPSETPIKVIRKLVAANNPAPASWPDFEIRKIHFSKISTYSFTYYKYILFFPFFNNDE